MSEQVHTPVVIIGAGPTGVMLAIELARRGVEVRVLDKQPERSQETRALGIHARTLEIFHQLGIVDRFLEAGHQVTGFTVHTPARRSTRVRFTGLDSPYPLVLILGQHETQRILDERLERLGVRIERGVTVIGIDHHAEGVQVTTTQDGQRREREFSADWVVGCDGAHSIVRRQLGLSFDGEDYGQDWLMSEVKIDAPIAHEHFHVFSYTAAPMVTFPMPSGRWRVFLPQVPNRAGERPPPDMEEIERLAFQRGPAGLALSDPTLLATFRCYRRSTKLMRHGRVLIAGDAAHIHSPAGGQGMNTGLQDAFNLGWKLGLVAHGHSPAALLDTYQAERVPIATGVLALTHALVRTFTIASPHKRWLRDRALPLVMAAPAAEHRYTHRLAQLSYNYRAGPLAPASRHVTWRGLAAGDRLPDVHGLNHDAKPVSTLDLLASPRHTLLVLTGTRAEPNLTDNLHARFARFVAIAQLITITGPRSRDPNSVNDPNLQAHRRYHARHGALLLVRPDGYLACRAPLNRPEIPERYLSRLTGSPGQGSDAVPPDRADAPGHLRRVGEPDGPSPVGDRIEPQTSARREIRGRA